MDKHFSENEQRLQAAALLLKIDSIEVTFDGSGDSGSIEDIQISSNGIPINDEKHHLEVWVKPSPHFDQEQRKWVQPPPALEVRSLRTFVENHVYEALEATGVDWCNNDGGYGTWEWNPQDGVDFSVYVRVTESVLQHSETRPLGEPRGSDEPESA